MDVRKSEIYYHGCEAVLPEDAFDAELIAMWRGQRHVDRDARCNQCKAVHAKILCHGRKAMLPENTLTRNCL